MFKSQRAKFDVEREPVEHERSARKKIRRRQAVTPAPHADTQPSATPPDHLNETERYENLMEALGTTDRHIAEGIYEQLLRACARDGEMYDMNEFLFSLAVLKDKKSKDPLDVMQRVQMAVLHSTMLDRAGEAARGASQAHRQSALHEMNQLARTYTAQLEGLKRYRAGAEQKVTYQNVSVTEGGQAIVGNVTQGTHGTAAHELANTTPALTDARQPAMGILEEPERVAIPLRKGRR